MECERKTDATGCESLWLFGEHQRFGARVEQRGGSCVQGALGGHGVVKDQAHAGRVPASRGGGHGGWRTSAGGPPHARHHPKQRLLAFG